MRNAGYNAFAQDAYTGFREYLVTGPSGRTTVQWTRGLSQEFYRPVPDPLFGYRLHFVDLAVNKVLASGSRMAIRDFVDLWMLDRHVIPLWRMVCAAPGKDRDFSPLSLVERMSRNWHFARIGGGGTDDRYVPTYDIPLDDMGADIRDSILGTGVFLDRVSHEFYGRLQVDDEGRPILSREMDPDAGRWMDPRSGGGLPSFPGIDDEMVAGLIAEYGRDGTRYTMDTGTASEPPRPRDVESGC